MLMKLTRMDIDSVQSRSGLGVSSDSTMTAREFESVRSGRDRDRKNTRGE